MATTLGKLFLASAVSQGQPATLLSFGDIAHVFTPTEAPLWDFVAGFMKEFGKLPEATTVLVHTGEELPVAAEPPEYYLELLQARHVEREVKRTLKLADGMLGVNDKNPDGALAAIVECAQRLTMQRMQHQVVDFREAYDVIVPTYAAQYTAEDGAGIHMGWPTLDEMTGGLFPGDSVGIVGKKGLGKTWQMLYGCHHGWKQQGACQMFVSMEMPTLQIEQRLAAMEASISAVQLKHAALSSKGLSKLKGALTEIKTANAALWLVDGNFAATVEEIDGLARHLKPDSIWIDGGYLMKHPTERDRYKRVAENAELIKRELAAKCPTVSSWQWSRDGSKKQKKKFGERPDLDDIGYSDAIGQTCSIVLGLFEDDNIETMAARVIEILKGRGGEVGRFRTRWDFNHCDFTEIVEEAIEDLKFD
jgi:replicative DNA helicase